MAQASGSVIMRVIVTILLTGMYTWLLYVERDIPRVLEGLRFVSIGIALVGTDAVIDWITKYINNKFKK